MYYDIKLNKKEFNFNFIEPCSSNKCTLLKFKTKLINKNIKIDLFLNRSILTIKMLMFAYMHIGVTKYFKNELIYKKN